MMSIGRSIRGFKRNERGTSIVEFALLAPVLLLLLLGTVTLFDLFRNLQSVEKATFTVGDMMSRQTVMNQTTLNNMLTLMRRMVPTASDGGLRVSSILNQSGTLVVQWTRTAGLNVPTTPVPTNVVPNIANGDSVLLTESFVPHSAFVPAFGIDAITFGAQASHRPRFVTTMAYQ
jgi:Flp pilus assembly protein TadG